MINEIEPIERWHVHVDGVVQGVGFRPFIYTLAATLGLSGWVLNTSAGVDIEVQGQRDALGALTASLRADAPPLAQIESMQVAAITTQPDETRFAIRRSEAAEGISQIPADAAICPACLAEIFDPENRRYRYPFTNCTHCGPRYTIIRSMPYDRAATTMDAFEMCPLCRAEYENPLDRRFHAQPNACPDCGPQVALITPHHSFDLPCLDDIARTADLLKQGLIVAIKGLGGFHLACDATNADAVSRLRERKSRPHKPLAVLVASLEQAHQHADIPPNEASHLASCDAPIMLVGWKANSTLAPNVAPDSLTVGLMLAYTPLHQLLLRDAGRPLVMTSGNIAGMPIIKDNDDALARLAGIADAFLLHNRPIHMRCDDSVWMVDQPIRRARGDAPRPISLSWSSGRHILALGGEMKNALCLLRGSDAYLSQHLGEMDSPEALDSLRDTLDHMMRLFRVKPQVIAHDLHPAYRTIALAEQLAAEWDVPRVGVQHHHAHIAACLAEHGRSDVVIGVAFDGTGYGVDGTIWGGEFLIADLHDYHRAAHLEALPLPGGEAAIHKPYRTALGYLAATQADIPLLPGLREISAVQRQVISQQAQSGLNTPLTSSCGRLFDAVAAMLGLCLTSSFEGQAAMRLEVAARRCPTEKLCPYPFYIESDGTIRLGELLRSISIEALEERAASEIAMRFHITLSHLIDEAARRIRSTMHIKTAALSGGVFQNRLLARLVRDRLTHSGFDVLEHRRVPANDGGLSLGQAVIASHSDIHLSYKG